MTETALTVTMLLVYMFGAGVVGEIAKHRLKDEETAFLVSVSWPLILIAAVAAAPVYLGICVARAWKAVRRG